MSATAVEQLADTIIGEGAIGVAEVARLVPAFRGTKSTHPSTVTRWMLEGVKLADGRRVHLQHVRCGGRLLTSRKRLVAFLEAQNENTVAIDQPRTPTERRRSAERAQEQLAELGVK